MKSNKIIGILVLFCVMTAGLLGGCAQTPTQPDIREGAAISPITAVFFPDDCTDFTGARLPTVQELRVSEENTAYTAVDGVIFTKDLETLVAFPAGRDGTYAVPDGTKKIAAVAFANCRIEEVYIPDSVTAIGNRAFDGCMALKEISFPTVFEADGNILPHCAALPEYIIDGLRIVHRGSDDALRGTTERVLPELCGESYAEGDAANTQCRYVTKYIFNVHRTDPASWTDDSIDAYIYTTITAEYLINGGDIVIPEGYHIDIAFPPVDYPTFENGDLQYARFPITSITFPNDATFFRPWMHVDASTAQVLNYYVKEDNPKYISADGIIFSKDLKYLVAFPTGRTGHYEIPDGTECVAVEAFRGTALESIYVPDSVRYINANAFSSSTLKEISLPAHADEDLAELIFIYSGLRESDTVITYRTAE